MQVPGATVSTLRALIYLSLLSITRRGDGVYTLTHSASLSTRSAGLAQTESKLGGRHQRLKLTQQNKTSDTGLASHRAGSAEERNTGLGSERGSSARPWGCVQGQPLARGRSPRHKGSQRAIIQKVEAKEGDFVWRRVKRKRSHN